MKKSLCFLLCVLLLTACQSAEQSPSFITDPPTAAPTDAPTQPPVQDPNNPCLQLLQALWDSYSTGEKFPCAGGDWENFVDSAPGSTKLDPEILSGMLLVPEDQVAHIRHAASLLHALNANTFTCGVFYVRDTDPSVFAQALRDNIQNTQWVCGFPQALLIARVDNNTVLSAFGRNDLISTLKSKLTSLYPDTQILYLEGIDP